MASNLICRATAYIIFSFIEANRLSVHARGSKRVRTAFIDESGRSSREPVTVVAGVIVHGDSQWKPVTEYLGKLIKEFVPPERQRGFVIHATDLFSGKALGEKWRDGVKPLKSWEFLKSVLGTPHKFGIPIAFAFCKRLDVEEMRLALPNAKLDLDGMNRNRVGLQHIYSYIECTKLIDKFVFNECNDEVCTLVVENIPEMHKIIRKTPMLIDSICSSKTCDWDIVPYKSIVGGVNFAEKDVEPLLQLSDACSWIVRRALSGLDNTEQFLEAVGIRSVQQKFSAGPAGGALLIPSNMHLNDETAGYRQGV